MKQITKSKLIFATFSLLLSLPLMAEELVKASSLTPVQNVLPMLLGLGGILALIFVLAMMVKKLTGLHFVSNNIKLIESQSLGAKEKLVIVEIQDQQYVLGVTAHSINQICQLRSPVQKKESQISFDKIMKQFLRPQPLPANLAGHESGENK